MLKWLILEVSYETICFCIGEYDINLGYLLDIAIIVLDFI